MGRRFDPDRAHFYPLNFQLVDYNPTMNQDLILKRITWTILLSGPFVSLAVSPSTSYDPINLIKLLFLSTCAFFILGLFLSKINILKKRLPKTFWAICIFFILSLLSTLVFSGAPFTQQIWGSFGRNTGFLTYVSLLFILIGAALIQQVDSYKFVINSLVLTAIPVSIYCLVQIGGMDPIGWSAKDTFATFGNTNFLSAFLGIASLACLILAFDKEKKSGTRLGLCSLALLDSFIILDTGSIQGFMILVAGIGVAGYFYLRSFNNLAWIKFPYIAISFFGFILTCLGVANKGPLATFIFQPSILFRADYMHAGWVMTLKKPFFGVGLDSYGDWYREVRGSISTLRTGPDRTANTAHNIFLDLSSNGGIPLISAYLALVGFAFFYSFKLIKSNKLFDPYFVAIFACWFAYQIQALVSINQIGVGIWGWILNGSLIGFSIAKLSNSENSQSKIRVNKKVLSPSSGLIVFATTAIGFILAFIPFNADSKYKTASQSRDLIKMMQSADSLGATSWHVSQVLNVAVNNNFGAQAKTLDNKMISIYPRDIYGWKILYYLTTSTPDEKVIAANKLSELDPFNPDNPKS